jgi:hypothetical protein
MNYLKTAFAVAAVAASIAPAAAQTAPNAAFQQMLAETGCTSKYSDEKKADLYEARWKGKPMTVVGEIATLNDGDVSVKVLRSTLTFDVTVKMKNRRDTYDLEKGQRVMLTFNVSYHGGCFLSYSGENGVIGNGSSASIR